MIALIVNRPELLADALSVPEVFDAVAMGGLLERCDLSALSDTLALTDPRVVDFILARDADDGESLFRDAQVTRRLVAHLSDPDEHYRNLREVLHLLDPSNPAIKRAVFDTFSGQPELTTASFGGLNFVMSNQDLGIAKDVFADHDFERAQLERYAQLRRPSPDRPYFVDVGSNFGSHGLLALALGGFQKALLVEPDPRLVNLLRANIALNQLGTSATVVPVACGNQATSMTLWSSRENWGDNRLTPSLGDEWFAVEVEVRPLTQILRELEISPDEVGCLWIDVQGGEPEVLEGAGEVTSAGCDVVLELWPEMLTKRGVADAFLGTLRQLGSPWLDLRTQQFVTADELQGHFEALLEQGPEAFTEIALLNR